MRFPDTFLDDIRDRLPISEVVGSRVTFDKKKTNQGRGDYWACCPFHGEKSPSFHCEDRKGRYHCFGCGVSGDHFRFLVELDGLSFPEAVERLADQAGIPMPIVDKRQQEREDKRATLYDVMEMATQYFEEQLHAPGGAKARAYLRGRGISPAIQKEFRIGYAPESRNALKEYLASKNAKADQIEACGMVVHGEGIAVSYDRFRDRIMFPIPDARERVIAFGGRALSADVPAKYLNSPETELFHKSNVLYNFAKARKPAYEKGQIIVAEGYMDVIALHAAGFPNAVAPLGTALTERQMLLLWRLNNEPLLCFDGDDAGLKAAYRSIDMLLAGLEPGRSARFALLPEGLDPDDLIKQEGEGAMRDVLNAALPLAEMIWNRETASGIFETPERRAELEARIRSITSLVKDESVRRHYEQDMRERLYGFFQSSQPSQGSGRGRGNFNAGKFGEGFSQTGGRYPSSSKSGKGRVGASPSLLNSSMVKKGKAGIPLREAALIMGAINHPAILKRYFDEFIGLTLSSHVMAEMRQKMIDIYVDYATRQEDLTAEQMRIAIGQTGAEELLSKLDIQLSHNRIWQTGINAAFEDAVDGWRQAYALHIRRHTLQRELKSAEQALASDDSDENLDRLLNIQTEIAKDDGMEALIEGFGVSSGRPSRTF
jgi:DNA primase